MTAQSRLTATEQVCLEAIQERDRLLVKLELVEGERDRYREGLRQIVDEYENATADLDAFEDHGGHVGIARHDRAVLQGLGTCAEIARATLAPALPARQMTLEDTRP